MRMNENYLLALAVACIAAALFLTAEPAITGHIIDINEHTAAVYVKEKTDAELNAFLYDTKIDIEQRQNISVEFVNTGTEPYETQITIDIYFYNNSRMIETATYVDSLAYLYPGGRKAYSVSFKPPYVGTYYIKFRASYGYKKIIAWGAFVVVIFPEIQEVELGPGSIEVTIPGISPIIQPKLSPDMKLNHTKSMSIAQAENKSIAVKLSNTGDLNLTNIRFYISSPVDITADISPKIVSFLKTGESHMFILSLSTDMRSKTGKYEVMLNSVSDQTAVHSSINVTVTEASEESRQDPAKLNSTIISYFYILSELESSSEYLVYYNIDISSLNQTLSEARQSIERAQRHFNAMNYQECAEELENSRQLLENAALEAGNLSLKLSVVQRFPYEDVVAVLLVISIILMTAYFYVKKRNRRPRILTESPEE